MIVYLKKKYVSFYNLKDYSNIYQWDKISLAKSWDTRMLESFKKWWSIFNHLKIIQIIFSLNQLLKKIKDKRFNEHDHITNRKLLWHGTSGSVVVAILKSGLRIMPHSGGRVGRG